MDKILTIAIPAYNAEWCLEKCISSLIDEKTINDLEVIVVDDGSTDSTGDIARRFVDRYPGSFHLISKENGGHGSAINTAVGVATGKYFKVIDADDWVITENLAPYINTLRENNADVVLTNFHMVDMMTGHRREFVTRGLKIGEIYTIDYFSVASTAAFKCMTFHGITYRTEFYQNTGLILPEKVFYEDQEYATSPFSSVKTILPLDMFLYQYLTGNSAQSVSDVNQVKRISDIERVALDVADCFNQNPHIPEGAKRVLIYKFCAIVRSYYVVALIKNKNRKVGRKDASNLRQKLNEINARLADYTKKDYNIILLMHFLRISSGRFQQMARSAVLKFAYEKRSGGQKNS